MTNRLLRLIALVGIAGCTHPTPDTRPGAGLEIVDWGGSGPPLVFLAGLGNTAHVFDQFAPTFTDRYHAIGITRRGFGASAGAAPPANLDALVGDIRAVLDSLAVHDVTLVGHSIAGEEMTRFGETNPTRCRALIYLDAAYDRMGANVAVDQPAPPPPHVGSLASADFAAIRQLHERILGAVEPESEIRATTRFDAVGHYAGEVATNETKQRIISFERTPLYNRVRCPSLGIYALPGGRRDVLPYVDELDAAGRAQADTLLQWVTSYVRRSAEVFAREPTNQTLFITSGHYVFLERPRDVARAMREFLDSSRGSAAR